MKFFQFKASLFLFLIFRMGIIWGQPLTPPIPFEDSYNGMSNFTIKGAKVKKKMIYFRVGNDKNSKILYTIYEYDKNGRLQKQIWYNILSGKEMYSAQYDYDKDNYLKSSVEKMTKEFDGLTGLPAKTKSNGDFFYTTTGIEYIPMDKDSNWVVKTIYKRDSIGYKAKKYFHDDSFYKEKDCLYSYYSPDRHENLYLNTTNTIDFICTESVHKSDTLYQSTDSLIISIKSKMTNKDSYHIFKKKINDEFVITEIDRICDYMRLYFDYINVSVDGKLKNYINSITYLSYRNSSNKCFLIHKFYSDLASLSNNIELNDIFKRRYYEQLDGSISYTFLEKGLKISDIQYSITDEGIKKMNEVKFTNNNLATERIQYEASFGLERSTTRFDVNNIDKAIEINEYEYFK
jgi:hypothetical protein